MSNSLKKWDGCMPIIHKSKRHLKKIIISCMGTLKITLNAIGSSYLIFFPFNENHSFLINF